MSLESLVAELEINNRIAQGQADTHSVFLGNIASGHAGSTLNLTARQLAAERAARRETRRLEREFLRSGRQAEWEDFVDKQGSSGIGGFLDSTMENLIDPAFDLLQIGQFTTVGLIQEILRTGSAWEGLKQAGIEFANALPGIELDEAGRPSFGDILRDQGASRWGAAAGGFVLDVLLDPINLIPGAVLAKGLRKAGSAGLKATGPVGESFARKFLSKYLLKRDAPQMLPHLAKYEASLENIPINLHRELDDIFGNISPEEARLLGLWLDSGHLTPRLDDLAKVGIIDESRIPALQDLGAIVKERARLEGMSEVEHKVMHHSMLISDYFAHVDATPGTKMARAQEKIIRERAKRDPRRGLRNPVRGDAGVDPGRMGASQHRTYKSTVERFSAMLSGDSSRTVELDVRAATFKRSRMHEQWIAFRKLLDNVISDREIATPIVPGETVGDPRLFDNHSRWSKVIDDYEKQYKGYRVLEVKQRVPDGERVVGAYLVPEPVWDVLQRAEIAYKSEDEVGKFLQFINEWTNVWKGWATFGTAYNMRNMISSANSNWIHGIGSSYKPGDILKHGFPLPGKFGLRYLQGFKAQMHATQAGRMPPLAKKALDRIMRGLGIEDWDSIPMPKLHDDNGKLLKSWDEITKLGEEWGVPQTATRVYDLPPGTDRKILEGFQTTIPISKVEQARVHSLSKAALTMGRDEGMNLGQLVRTAIGTDNPLIKLNRAWAQIVENQARWAMFFDDMEKGAKPFDAMMATKTWHYDYRNLTTFEKKWLRNLMPFYSWTRFNLPRQIMAMVENPGRYSKIPKLKQAIESLSSQMDDYPEPDYFAEVQAIQMGYIHKDRPLYAQFDLPVMDLNRLNPKDLASSLHPMIKSFEYLPRGGYSYFKEAPIEAFPGQRSEGIPSISRLTEAKLEAVFPPFGKYVSRPAKAAKRGVLDEQIASELLGIRLRTIDARRVTRGNTFRRRKLAREFAQRIKQDAAMGL